ncbi:MAG: 7TM diverse intracellular signaling domain-containing protein [Oligoflexus sp.]
MKWQRILAGLFLFLTSNLSIALAESSFLAKMGVIDLSEWQPSDKPEIRLDGEWILFQRKFLSPRSIVAAYQQRSVDSSGNMALVPGTFEDIPDSQRLGTGEQNFGTYAIKLVGLDPDMILRISTMRAYTSARIYWFAEDEAGETMKPIAEIGRPGRSRHTTIPWLIEEIPALLSVKPDQAHYFVIHVANFHHYWGGLWIPPTIGPEAEVNKIIGRNHRRNYLILGALLIIALYNFSLFLQRNEDRGSLLLTLFTTLILVRMLALTYPDAIWSSTHVWQFELQWKIDFLTIIWPSIVFLGFIRYYFQESVHKKTLTIFLLLSSIASLGIIFLPAVIFSPYLYWAQVYVMTTTVYCIYTVFHAARRKKQGAGLSLVGSSILLISTLNDVLYTYGWTELPEQMISFGVVLFVLFQSQIVGVRFARAFRQAEHLSRELQVEVNRQTRDIKSILESINQGIFTIHAPRLTIGDDHSSYLVELLGERIKERNVFEVFFSRTDMSKDEQDQMKTVLDFVIGEDSLAFEGNDHCLPRTLTLQDPAHQQERYLELDWSPIVDHLDAVEKVLVCIRDVTELRALRTEAAQNREELDMIGQILNISAARFQRFLKQAHQLVEENRKILADHVSAPHPLAIRSLFVNMHTLKGIARTYNLVGLTESVHQAEQYYALLQKDLTAWDMVRLHRELDEVNRVIAIYQHINTEKLGRYDHLDHIILPHHEWKNLVDAVHRLASKTTSEPLGYLADQCMQIVNRYYYTPIEDVFDEVISSLDSLAKELGKEAPRVLIQSNGCGLTSEGASLLNNIITHLVRNALDHGIESAAIRQSKGKSVHGEIHVLLCDVDDGLLLKFWDDGQGLDLAKIRKLANERGLIKTDDQLSAEELAQLIFESGFSTKTVVSSISGRGVGMDAVRVYLERLGGRIEIRLLEGTEGEAFRPFEFRIIIPHNLFGQLTLAS